ncbi:hypothetical protein [Parasitella parasitica]|uniref:DH domain-containing protein n=1 Tax=Parasitella parasitica TaxID=35722 RepID=A0A0B7NB06_9FUNG|nr:hypothetical protein [Parasitella parasitica]
MQQLDVSLDSIGYIYSRKLIDNHSKNQQKPALHSESVCHFYDILVHDPKADTSSGNHARLYEQFTKIITSPSAIHHHLTPSMPRQREFVKNNERRRRLLDEFIATEANYLSSLKTFVSVSYHYAGRLMRRFTCYNKFLLGVNNAQTINEKQMKVASYFHFVEKVIDSQSNGNQTVYDYLALPELMKHTSDDHPDLSGLHGSLLKAEEIASMTEEIHTQLMKIFHRLLQAIQYCPESLISFQRRLVGYLDTIELDPATLKPIQPVTLFLFSDKIMVVKRPSYEADGLDLCGLDQRIYEGSERSDFCLLKEAITGKMKFIGWASVNEIDVYDGSPDSFCLVCNNSRSFISSPDTDQATQKSLEAYFQHDQQKHCFQLDQVGGGNSINKEHFQTVDRIKLHFIYQFGKCKNDIKQCDELIQSTYCQWNRHHFYANIYPTSKYHQVINKNEIALFYIESNTINIEAILSNCFVAPSIVGFIVPHEKDDNYRFAVRSKCAIGNTLNDEISLLTFQSNDAHQIQNAQNQLFDNLVACDRDLSKSTQRTTSAAPVVPRPPTPSANSRLSMITQDLVRKKSKSTFKLFTALANPVSKPLQKQKVDHARSDSPPIFTNTPSASSPMPSSATAKPRATSPYSEYVLGLETFGSSAYHNLSSAPSAQSSNSSKSQQSHEAKLKLQSLVSKDILPQSSSVYRSASESPENAYQQRYFSPSFHPSRSASYEIQVRTYRFHNSIAPNKRASEGSNTIFTNNNNKFDRLQSSRSRSPLSIGEPTPAMSESGSGFSTLHSQASSTISTFENFFSHYRIQERGPCGQKLLDSAAITFVRPLSDPVIPITTQGTYKNSFLQSDTHLELEEKNKTLTMLTCLLQKKEEEIDILKAELNDSFSELGTVCDKYNSELKQLASMYKQNELDRPANPSPDVQIQKKLESTLRERNQWQLRAIDLEHQLRLMVLDQRQQGSRCDHINTHGHRLP